MNANGSQYPKCPDCGGDLRRLDPGPKFIVGYCGTCRRDMRIKRACSICGCTHDEPCVTGDGTCRWVGMTLCSVCNDKKNVGVKQ